MSKPKAIVMKPIDNVATVVENVTAGTEVKFFVGDELHSVVVKKDIPFGHKFAIVPIAKDDEVIKYGYPIGSATCDIEVGEYVHVHNIGGLRGRGDLQQ